MWLKRSDYRNRRIATKGYFSMKIARLFRLNKRQRTRQQDSQIIMRISLILMRIRIRAKKDRLQMQMNSRIQRDNRTMRIISLVRVRIQRILQNHRTIMKTMVRLMKIIVEMIRVRIRNRDNKRIRNRLMKIKSKRNK